ncbi:MAG: hypothetical protein ACO3AF_09855 [Flavobacteriales bacterium]|jgi:hypothetical protein
MKKHYFLMAVLTVFTVVSCSSESCDEDQAADAFIAAATAYSDTFGSNDCQAITAAWEDYVQAYENQCENQKDTANWSSIVASHTNYMETIGC